MNSQPPSKLRRRLLGPGTVVALIVAVGIWVFGLNGDRPAVDANLGQTRYSADHLESARGSMHASAVPGAPIAKPPPLWKPEVDLILQHGSQLQLSDRQKQRIEALHSSWTLEKTSLEEAMRSAVSSAGGTQKVAQRYHSASASQITGSLGDYSRLSQQYNEQRAACWLQALAALTTEQKTVLERLTVYDRKGRSL